MAAERSAGGKQVPQQDGQSHPDSKGEKCVSHVFVCAQLCLRAHVCEYVRVCVRACELL